MNENPEGGGGGPPAARDNNHTFFLFCTFIDYRRQIVVGGTDITVKEKECSNIIWRFGGLRRPSYGGGGWPNCHIAFIVTEKA